MRIFALMILLRLLASASDSSASMPAELSSFLQDYCLDCHDKDAAKGSVELDFMEIDWSDDQARKLWPKVLQVLETKQMPPPKKKSQPSEGERQAVTDWLDQTMSREIQPGGTVIRRLNREEYENSVRKVLGIPFKVPGSFPPDSESHGFDNIGEGLILSPPLMAQYVAMATQAADQILPPDNKVDQIPSRKVDIGPGDFVLNFTTGYEIDGVLRMVSSSDPLARGSVWPNRFEASVRGIYKVTIDLSVFKPVKGHLPIVHLLAHRASGQAFAKASTLRKLAEFELGVRDVQNFEASVELHRGETVVVHYENAALSSDNTNQQAYLKRIANQLTEAFRQDPELGAAWIKAGYQRSDRGWSWWKRIQEVRDAAGFDASGFDPDSEASQAAIFRFAKQGVNTVETMCCLYFHTGPGIDIHGMSVSGPSKVFEDREVQEQKKRTEQFLGRRGDLDDLAYAQSILRSFLDKAFRRPVTDQQLERYVSMALDHKAQGHSFKSGIHLAVRAALCSTHFLFRGSRDGRLDDFDLAARLSYFLTSNPPDHRLRKWAAEGRLSDPDILESETRRLLKSHTVKNFLNSFTGQWLDLRLLPQIMPDPRLLRWTDKDLTAITAETQLFVQEILTENHPLETFIDPNFTYLNRRNAKLYGIDHPKSDAMTRVSLGRGGRNGGILTQASVLMATANGVDTQPVLRGAWMLENILGTPTPAPPDDVPAIEPDTSGARSIRELLELHQADDSCARCHKRIDPPGFVLENFDPVGRWREHYPVYEKKGDKVQTRKGLPVESRATLPDGTLLNDVTDLKRYLVQNIDIFSHCLTEKLLTYGTGRPMNFGDQKVIEQIVSQVREEGNGFADLIVAIVISDAFSLK